MAERLKLAMLISGTGTTAEAVIRACQSGRLNLEPVLVIASNKKAGGIEKAERLGIETRVTRGEEVMTVLKEAKIDIVSLNGYLAKILPEVIEYFGPRIVNQHPGPLDGERPDFGGEGMVGGRVVCATVAFAGVVGGDTAWTEATVHQVTEKYDEGPIIRSERMDFEGWGRVVSIEELETDPKELMERVAVVQRELLVVEHENVIEAITRVISGQDWQEGREEPLIDKENWGLLADAKKMAISLYPRG